MLLVLLNVNVVLHWVYPPLPPICAGRARAPLIGNSSNRYRWGLSFRWSLFLQVQLEPAAQVVIDAVPPVRLVVAAPSGAVGVGGAGGHCAAAGGMFGRRGCCCLVAGGAVGGEGSGARA